MREYTSPLIDDMDVSVEGVYAGSGSSPDIPDIPIIPPKDDPTPPGGVYAVEKRRDGLPTTAEAIRKDSCMCIIQVRVARYHEFP